MGYAAREIVITGQGILCAHGIGAEAFAAGLGARGRQPAGEPLGPLAAVAKVPGFDVRAQLGRAGTRSFDRTTGMVVTASQLALTQRELGPATDRSRVGVVVGSAHGSLRSIVEFNQDIFIQKHPYMVNPAHVPNTVMNCAAGQAAIWHGLGGVNATISTGSTSGFQAFEYARTMLARGYADHILAGAVEELSEHTAWRVHAVRDPSEGPARLGEGCAMFAIETAERARASGATILAVLGAVRVFSGQTAGGEDEQRRLERVEACMRRTLAEARVEPGRLWATCRGGSGVGRLAELEQRALDRIRADAGQALAHRLCLTPELGDTLSASGAMQLAAVIALHRQTPRQGPRPVLCTAVMEDGTVACMVIEAAGD